MSVFHPIRTLAVIPSFECDIACNHCVFSSSPHFKGRIQFDVLTGVIAQLISLAGIRRLVVSGGEPFLDQNYLRLVAELARDHSLEFRVVTNGNFAVSLDVAIDALSPLCAIGLDTLGVSWDCFHAKFGGASRTRNLLRAARILGLQVQLTVVVTKEHTLSAALEYLGDEAFDVPMTQVRALPVGRAKEKIPATAFIASPEWKGGRACRRDFDTLAITYEGSMYPCCSVGGFTEGISLGNAISSPISTLLRRRELDFRFALLGSKGPNYLLKYASPEEIESYGIDIYDHDCVKCNRIFGTNLGETLLSRVQPIIQQEIEVLIKSYPRNTEQ